MVPKEENNESTQSQTSCATLEESAYLFSKQLERAGVHMDSPKQLQDSTFKFFSNVMNFSSQLRISACVTLIHFPARIRWLHKNKQLISIDLSTLPTNNNTHTPAEKPVTS